MIAAALTPVVLAVTFAVAARVWSRAGTSEDQQRREERHHRWT